MSKVLFLYHHCLRLFSFLFLHFFVSLERSLFQSISVPLSFFLCMESTYAVVYFFLPDGVFLPCHHGLDFLDQLIM